MPTPKKAVKASKKARSKRASSNIREYALITPQMRKAAKAIQKEMSDRAYYGGPTMPISNHFVKQAVLLARVILGEDIKDG